MSDRNDSNTSLGALLKNSSAFVLAVISFISSIYGFVKLFADKDAGLVTLISLIVGILLLLGICLYYARFWKPEGHDKGRSAFDLSSDEQVKAQAKKERRRKIVRRSALAGLILIPILSISGFAGWQYVQNLPTKDIIILVAEFDGPDSKNYRVAKNISEQLVDVTQKYSDVRIQRLNQVIYESEIARQEGKKHKATIVIWGDYGVTDVAVQVSTHFEVLHPPKELPKLLPQASGMPQTSMLAELKSFTLQTRLSQEMSYLSLLTLGITRYAAADWDGAISRFNDALSQKVECTSRLNQSFVYFYRGLTYLQKGDYNRALADSNQAIKLQPDLSLAYNNRGLIYYFKGDYDLAIADFSHALKFQPDSDVLQSKRTNFKVNQTVIDSNREFPTFSIFTLEFSNSLIYNNRGLVYLAKGDYDGALADFNQATKVQPNLAISYFNRASAYFSKGNYDRALTDCNQVIELQPDLALAYIKRGVIYYAKGDANRAIGDFSQAIKLQPDLVLAYSVRGDVYSDKGNYNRAISDYSQALKLKPNFKVYNQRGLSYAKKGDYDRAITDYRQALTLKPDDVRAYNNRGISYKNKGDYDHAIADYNQALKLKPDYVIAYANRGNAYTKKGDYDRALADANQALKLKPDEAGFYDNRGYVYAFKGDYDRALADANQALKLKPNSVGAYNTRGLAYAGKGDYERAIADYNQALTLNITGDKDKIIVDFNKPIYTFDDAEVYYHRGLAYRKKGDEDKAVADFKKTLELSKEPKMRQDAEKQLQELGVK